jgi:hypothetical protein
MLNDDFKAFQGELRNKRQQLLEQLANCREESLRNTQGQAELLLMLIDGRMIKELEADIDKRNDEEKDEL